MNTLYSALIFLSGLVLTACSNNKEEETASESEVVFNSCIPDQFTQKADDAFYGIECIEGKHILIKTKETGEPVSTSHAISDDNTDGLRLEGTPHFINKFYSLKYTILRNKGDDKQNPFLRDLLPENEIFFGASGTEYRIIFEIKGNYLVLFKASENLNHLPYVERTSVTKSQDGKYWMVPFLGYPVEYCNAGTVKHQDQDTYEDQVHCQKNPLEGAKYIRFHRSSSEDYNYKYKEKKDLFPSDYFKGKWIFVEGVIQTPLRKGHSAPPVKASLVQLEKTADFLNVVDVSGNVEKRNQRRISQIPVQWVNYEPDQTGDMYKTFGERFYKVQEVATNKPYLQIDFPRIIARGLKITDFLVGENYISYVIEGPVAPHIQGAPNGQPVPGMSQWPVKFRVSLLRETAVNDENFIPKKWFRDIHDHYFGIFPIEPQFVRKVEDDSVDDFYDQARMIHFNTGLNTEQEKRTKIKIIPWYFSKESTQESDYRELAAEAVRIYDRAFEIITEDSEEQIRVKLMEGEKDLGDLRYNIINLVKTEELSPSAGGRIMYGEALTYAHANTGQIIGTTISVFIHEALSYYKDRVKNYIRYEIFQKDKKTNEENEIHVVTPYLRSQITKQCRAVQQFINSEKKKNPKPSEILDDDTISLSCARTLSKKAVLAVLLHEMGHGFGLAHNFKASIDEVNFYQSVEELKSYFPQARIQEEAEIIKTSSVMDYLPFNVPFFVSLGKYDLAALRFLYRNQMEGKQKGQLLSFNIPSDPALQNPPDQGILDKRKNYLHCSDMVLTQGRDPRCSMYDHGYNPEEIVRYYISMFKRAFHSLRYRYDAFMPKFSGPVLMQDSVLVTLEQFNWEVLGFYRKWIELRDHYLRENRQMEKARYILNDETSVKEYERIIAEGVNSKEEYRLYYEARDEIFTFFMDLLFLESIRCRVKNNFGVIRDINLERIKETLPSSNDEELHVEDCYSERVKNFLTANGLTVTGQAGVEDFKYYHYRSRERRDHRMDVKPLSEIDRPLQMAWIKAVSEPDFLNAFRVKLEKKILEERTGKYMRDFNRILGLYEAVLIGSLARMFVMRDKDAGIYRAHLNDLKTVQFSLGTGGGSFYQRVLRPLNEGKTIEDIAIPFLTISYEEYKKQTQTVAEIFSVGGFRQFLSDRDDVLYVPGELLIIPFQRDSFSSRIISKYNEDVKAIEKWNGLEGLTFLEEVEKNSLEEHKDLLRQIIDRNIRL